MSEQLPLETLTKLKQKYNPDVSPMVGNTGESLAESVFNAVDAREGFLYEPESTRRGLKITEEDMIQIAIPVGVWGLLFETMMKFHKDPILSAFCGLLLGTLAYIAVHHLIQESPQVAET